MKSYSKAILLLIFLVSNSLFAQDSTWKKKPELHLDVFADAFYVFDFNQPKGTSRQNFLFNHNRHNEFNLNLGLLKFGVNHKKYRGNIGFHAGTYADDNYSAEPGLLKNIFEANVGISLSKQNKLWVDVGILPSHIGFESAISTENLTLTRSLCAENSPYFLTGAKLTYTPNEKIELVGLIVNGWQRIQRVNGNSLPSFGTQLTIRPNTKTTFNWSAFIGTDDPDSIRRMRYFSNLYGQFDLGEKFKLIAGFDIGMQQRIKHSSIYDVWFTPILIGQLKIAKKWKTGLRFEYFHDERGIIIPTGTLNGFQTVGASLNFDYQPIKNISWRIEARWLHSKDKIFEFRDDLIYNNLIIATSLAVKLNHKFK